MSQCNHSIETNRLFVYLEYSKHEKLTESTRRDASSDIDLDSKNSYPPSVTTSEIPPMREESKATGVGFIVVQGLSFPRCRQKQFSPREELIGFPEPTRVYRVWFVRRFCTNGRWIPHEPFKRTTAEMRDGERWKGIWNARVRYKRDTRPRRSEIDVLLSG